MRRLYLKLLMALSLVIGLQSYLSAKTGEELFAKHCEACHGENGEGGVGVPLSLPSFVDSVDGDYLRKTIRLGRPGRIMPGFSQLKPEEIESLVDMILSWSSKEKKDYPKMNIVGDTIKGSQLYLTHCKVCHGQKGQGSKGTGVTFSRERNLPIMAPAIANSGFLAAATDTMIRDILINGRESTPMISFLDKGLTRSDINDLVAYIRSLEKERVDLIHLNQSPIIRYDSDYSLEETVNSLKNAITGRNFRIIRTQYLNEGLVPEGQENKKQVIVYFCNFKFLFDSLAIDPRIGMFLPCRITVIETEEGVSILAANPLAISALFNNDALNDSCVELRNIYEELLEDATL